MTKYEKYTISTLLIIIYNNMEGDVYEVKKPIKKELIAIMLVVSIVPFAFANLLYNIYYVGYLKEQVYESNKELSKTMSEEVASSIEEEILASSEEIAASSQEMSASTEQVLTVVQVLNGMTKEMEEGLNQFKLSSQ